MQMRVLKNINTVKFILLHLLVVIFIIFPFLPGPYNKVSVILGMIGNVTALLGLVLIPIGFFWWIRKIKTPSFSKLPSTGLYLITIPLIALGTRMFIAKPMSNYSRNFAIERSQQLVTSIEEFKNYQGRYPENMQELKSDIPRPFIMGIDKFRYTKYQDQYFLTFSQWPDGGITEEIVLFGKENPEKRWIPQEEYNYQNDMHRVMGAFASYNTRYDHWRYYLCD